MKFFVGTAVLTGLILFAVFLWPKPDLAVHEQTVSAATTRLKAVLGSAKLSTAQGIWHLVFPFDFFSSDGPFDRTFGKSWQVLATQSLKQLTPAERNVVELYRWGRAHGFDPEHGRRFVVIPVLARAGVDLNQSPTPIQNSLPHRETVIKLPPVRLTDLIILEEENSQAFPEVPLTPAQWRTLIELVQPCVGLILKDRGLGEEAREGALKFYRAVYAAAGVKEAHFETSVDF
ncbi:MAG: DUF4230 domain-containing protein [Spirochaetales bacterium]|nr:DUF4230 domain-containing protein [Spirochaetales bacterium]